jgi:UDP-N-acetylglucosamine transferase subunit ALG13
MKVFVTVGTTEFDELIKQVTNVEFLKLLREKGYTSMTIQKGKGYYIPNVKEYKKNFDDFTMEVFDFDESLDKFMKAADLIISHGGAGKTTQIEHISKDAYLKVYILERK